ncbi:thiamine phosphate synthase [Chiayiivirga flava]|uniref:Thiamine-phosphate synthase n=1 Tax=Chiayiivirga flava TaxID=659595 RepID=A0A7W8D6D3_9GAMM|nr:thiamine phosphate synthase [Chiayiivirga flava]MBB5207556.1 thiamine-phosphate pyrophosphorylase [Chiayiivirga flava]
MTARGLYLLTPDEDDTARLLRRVASALHGGVAWLQYRNKAADAALRAQQAHALAALCARFDVPLLINDDVALALQLRAGVHLGEHDGDIAAARSALGPDALIGASCYDDAALATRAVEAGASYVAFGAFFASSTKPHARRASLSLLRGAATLGVPRVAIGGITPDNGRSLVDAGADLLAVISGVFDAPDPAAAVAAYNACFRNPA